MHRFYVRPEDMVNERVMLCPRETHHALHVLRVRPGEVVELLDGAGQVCRAEVVEAARRAVVLRVWGRRRELPPAWRLTLVVGLIKAGGFEEVLEKATELGVTGIQPVLAARSVVRLRAEEVGARREKWRWVAVDALKQCGGAWLPEVGELRPLGDWLRGRPRFDLEVFGGLGGGRETLRGRLERYRREHGGRLPGSVAAYVGPEGDFTLEESAALERAGVDPVWLGPRVLRSETAALVFAAVIQSEFLGNGG
ncbi:RsmE family RNA methyltransferase [Limisphaera ngatamarikiensis]|uniref:RsmE family RNA methyltransferase n=1 Tax=Limisphaera ngatamarikiensis TaxID=1324935 RepID=UPI0023EF4D48|nr:RsmE family RNA methyltransferase [Limisphaera ngatamarikiensis]